MTQLGQAVAFFKASARNQRAQNRCGLTFHPPYQNLIPLHLFFSKLLSYFGLDPTHSFFLASYDSFCCQIDLIRCL